MEFWENQRAQSAAAMAERIAEAHVRGGGDPVELFAAFAGMLAQEHEALARQILENVRLWSGRPAPRPN